MPKQDLSADEGYAFGDKTKGMKHTLDGFRDGRRTPEAHRSCRNTAVRALRAQHTLQLHGEAQVDCAQEPAGGGAARSRLGLSIPHVRSRLLRICDCSA